MDYEFIEIVENKTPVVVSLTNFSDFLKGPNDRPQFYDSLFPIEVPTIRPAFSMKKIDLNKRLERVPKSRQRSYRSYHRELKQMLNRRRAHCGTRNIVLLDVNVVPTRSDCLIWVDGSTSCHPFIVGQIVFQYQVGKMKIDYIASDAGEIRRKYADPEKGIHVVSIGFSKKLLDLGEMEVFGHRRTTYDFLFEAVAMAGDAANKISLFQA